MKKRNALNPTTLRVVLTIGMIPLIGVSLFITHLFFKDLEQKSKKALHAQIDYETSSENVEKLKELQTKLNSSQDIIAKTAAIVSDSKMYQYQNDIINDINTYASASGVEVQEYNFGDNGAEGAGMSSSGSEQPNPADGSGETQSKKISGLKSVNPSITLRGPTPLSNFLIFLKYIEQNITKMQVTGVELTPDTESPGMLGNTTINVTVYTR